LARRAHLPGAGSVAEQLAAEEARLGLGPGEHVPDRARPVDTSDAGPANNGDAAVEPHGPRVLAGGLVLRRARLDDVPGIAAVMAAYVAQGVLLPRPVSELYQCVREFHVVEDDGRIVACAALRVLWKDMGEVRSLAVRPDRHGRGLGARLVESVVADARAVGLPRIIALTREVAFFERCGFAIEKRETLPRKVWTDCVRCPKRHACDEVAVVLDLVPGASEAAARDARLYTLPMPQAVVTEPLLPILS